MRGDLAKEGIHYPRGPFKGHDYHHIIVGLLGEARLMPRSIVRKHPGDRRILRAAKAFVEKAMSDAKVQGHHTVVFSTERLVTKQKEDLIHRLAFLNEVASSVMPVFYVREPAANYASQMQQAAKNTGRFLLPFEMRPLRKRITEFERLFSERPIVRGFSRQMLVDGDISRDFFSAVLKSDLKPKPFTSNTSMSLEAAYLLMKVGRFARQHGLEDDRDVMRQLTHRVRVFDRTASGYSRCDIKEDLKQEIRRAAVDHVWLKDEYGIVFPDVDYANVAPVSEETRQKYLAPEDVADIDPDKVMQFMFDIVGVSGIKGLKRLSQLMK